MTEQHTIQKCKDLLTAFADSIQLKGLQIEEDGHCCLVFDEVILNFEPDPPSNELVLYAQVGDLSFNPSSQFLLLLLEGNFAHKATNGASIGIDPQEHIIGLFRRLNISGLELQEFETYVDKFVHTAHQWIELLNKAAQVSDSDDDMDTSNMRIDPNQFV